MRRVQHQRGCPVLDEALDDGQPLLRRRGAECGDVHLVYQPPHVRIGVAQLVPLWGTLPPEDLHRRLPGERDPKHVQPGALHRVQPEDRGGPEVLLVAELHPIVPEATALELLAGNHLRGLPEDRQHLP